MAPLVSLLKEHGFIEARSVHQRSSFEAGVAFARAEGILPAPEPSHAIRVAIDEANAAKEAGEARVILFNLCGHGHFDLSAYERYLDGSLEDYEYPAEKVEAALRRPARASADRAAAPDAATRLLEMRAPAVHGLAARVAVRRGATLPALRREPEPRAARNRAARNDRRRSIRPTIRARPTRRNGGSPSVARLGCGDGRRAG